MAELSETILQQIHHFSNLMHRERHQQRFNMNSGLHVNRGQGQLMGILLESDGLPQKELSAILHIRPSSLGELVFKLEQNGYVERRANEKDKRITNVYLTKKGRGIVQEITKSRSSFIHPLFSGLSEEELTQLSALMGKLIESAEANQAERFDGVDERLGGRGEFGGRPGDRRGHGFEGREDSRDAHRHGQERPEWGGRGEFGGRPGQSGGGHDHRRNGYSRRNVKGRGPF
ncbi:putative HTH-type transcriptional regulator YusO [compost metagenome]